MITTYLLKNCQHCKGLLEYLKQNPNVNVCLIMISKDEIPYVKYQEPRIKEFPVAFSGFCPRSCDANWCPGRYA